MFRGRFLKVPIRLNKVSPNSRTETGRKDCMKTPKKTATYKPRREDPMVS